MEPTAVGMRQNPVKAWCVVGIAAFLLAACGSGHEGASAGGSAATASTRQPAHIDGPSRIDGVSANGFVGCRGGPFFPAGALDTVVGLDEAGRPEVEAAIAPFLIGEEGSFWPQADQWSILHESEDSMLLVASDGDSGEEAQVGFMTIELRDDAWQWAGSSLMESCPLYRPVPEGFGEVEWRLDPEGDEPGPKATRIDVLASERACASSRPMGDRVVGPEVGETDESVMISFVVRPLAGDQTCPSNPQMAFTIELESPLGDREVIDGRQLGVTLEELLTR